MTEKWIISENVEGEIIDLDQMAVRAIVNLAHAFEPRFEGDFESSLCAVESVLFDMISDWLDAKPYRYSED